MNSKSTRRSFLKQGAGLCMACSAMAFNPGLSNTLNAQDNGEIPNPKKLNYCGYTCPSDCKFLQATLKNDTELKKECYKEWKIKEQHGIAFDPEKIVCYTCKTDKEFKGVVVENCTVRNCAVEKELDCCIECNELTSCDKELWQRFPDFHKSVIKMQEKLQAAT